MRSGWRSIRSLHLSFACRKQQVGRSSGMRGIWSDAGAHSDDGIVAIRPCWRASPADRVHLVCSFRSGINVTPEDLYLRLGQLLETMPDLYKSGSVPAETLLWLGRAHAL
ncbi:MAG: hypothetical protein JWP65_534, partial [Ramlibacter sp.]|nr:hypothetical protein [Ramlibacter sp.]